MTEEFEDSCRDPVGPPVSGALVLGAGHAAGPTGGHPHPRSKRPSTVTSFASPERRRSRRPAVVARTPAPSCTRGLKASPFTACRAITLSPCEEFGRRPLLAPPPRRGLWDIARPEGQAPVRGPAARLRL